ncbi:MAG: phage tail family protein [Bacteroidales bacterium]|nr:phage tail family protein [Candidatus Colimorpha merdihippi]
MRISNEKLVLHIPCDDDNEDRAYDYSLWRTAKSDGVLSASGATFTTDAVFGKAIHIEDTDGRTASLSVREDHLVYNEPWTITCFVKVKADTIGFSVLTSDETISHQCHVNAGEWYFIALVYDRQVGVVSFWLNTEKVFEHPIVQDPVFWSISDTLVGSQNFSVDEIRIYNRVLAPSEIVSMQSFGDDVDYIIDGVNFSDYSVYVSGSDGLIDGLQAKERVGVDYPDYHGTVVDLSNTRFESREIKLDCFIEAKDNFEFVEKVRRFLAVFQRDGFHRLSVIYASSAKPLVYDVYLQDSVEIDKTWNQKTMVGTFSITLIEPSPVKVVLRHVGYGYGMFRVTSRKMFDVTWDDVNEGCEISTDGVNWSHRNTSCDLSGTGLFVRHFYQEGSHDIIIHGVVEDMTDLQTSFGIDDNEKNDIVVWSRL